MATQRYHIQGEYNGDTLYYSNAGWRTRAIDRGLYSIRGATKARSEIIRRNRYLEVADRINNPTIMFEKEKVS